MFSFGNKSNIIDKARRIAAKGEPSKAIDILKNGLTDEEDDLPLILEIMHTYITMDKLNEVIVWAKKGEELSKGASKKVISEMEDLYYGRGKPDQIGEFLIEKKAESENFEELEEISRELSEQNRRAFLERELKIVNNILQNREKYSHRDLIHLYTAAIMCEGEESKRAVEIFMEILDKHPEKLETITMELRRASNEHFGDPELDFGLSKTLIMSKRYIEATEKMKKAMNRDESMFKRITSLLREYTNESRELMDYLSELYIESDKEDEALKLIDEFETKEAIQKYQRMVKKNPENPVIHRELAEAYVTNERYSEALKEYLETINIEPHEEVLEEIEKFRDRIPENLDNLLTLSSIYYNLGKEEEAVDYLRMAFEVSPSMSDEILDRLDSIIKEEGEFTEAMILKAKLLSRKGDVNKALSIYKNIASVREYREKTILGLKKLKKENPANTEIDLIIDMLRIPDEPEDVSQEINHIISQEPDYVPFMLTEFDEWIRNNPNMAPQFLYFYELLDSEYFPPFTYPFALAELKRITGDIESAERLYNEAIQEEPERYNFVLNHLRKYRENPEVRKIIASLYFGKGEYEKGCKEIKTITKQFPDYVSDITTFLINRIKTTKESRYLYRTLTEILLDNEYYEEAVKWGEKAIDNIELKDQGNLLLALSEANAKLDNYSKASQLARKAWSIDKSLTNEAINILEIIVDREKADPDILMSLYELYKEREKLDKCIKCLDNVLNQKPTMADIIVGEYEKLIELAPIDASLRIHYGKAKLMIDDETGIKEIEKGLKFNPDLKEEALDALGGYKDPEIANKSLLVKSNLLSSMGRINEAVDNYINLYWEDEEERDKILKGIEDLLDSLELDRELFVKLFKIYKNEIRNTKLVELVDSYFDETEKTGKYILKVIENEYTDNIPLPLRVSRAKINYLINNKEKASEYMFDLLSEFPDVATELADIVDFYDRDITPLLIELNLTLSNYDKALQYINKLPLMERLTYLEKLLDRKTDHQESLKEAGYLYTLIQDIDKVRLYLTSLEDKSDRDKILLWFAGEDMEVNPADIKKLREEILLDRVKITDSNEKKARLYIKLKRYEDAYKEIKNLENPERDLLLSYIELKNNNYWRALKLLQNLEDREEVKILKYKTALGLRNFNLCLKILMELDVNPERISKHYNAIVKSSSGNYNKIIPIIGR